MWVVFSIYNHLKFAMKKFFIVLLFLAVPFTANADFKPFFVVTEVDSYEVILQDKWGDQFLVEYGIGCLSMWRYVDEVIYVDVGGAFLDGIGDTIYLLDTDDDCRVWDVEELDGYNDTYSPSIDYNLLLEYLNQCPDNTNGFLGSDGICYCNVGYEWNVDLNQCTELTLTCGSNQYLGNNDVCYCNNGYYWDESTLRCEIVPLENECGLNSYSTGDGECLCDSGYVWVSDDPLDFDCELADANLSKSPFSDLSSLDPDYDAILFLFENNIVQGYEDGTFRSSNEINRAELLKILVESKGVTPFVGTYNNCFSDVDSEWFASYVCFAKSAGWIDGYPDGSFQPAKTINKVEALKMLLNSQSIEIPESVTAFTFEDVNNVSWYAPYVAVAKELGITNEQPTAFHPDSLMTRGKVSGYMYRLLVDL